MDLDISAFDFRTQQKIKKRTFQLATMKAKKLASIKDSAIRGAKSNPVFGTKLINNAMRVYGARQNPASVPSLYTNLPTAARIPTMPHPVLTKYGWKHVTSVSDNRRSIPDVRYADTGEDIDETDVTFFYSKKRQLVYAAQRRRPYTIRPLETDFALPDFITEEEWDKIIDESFIEAFEEVTNEP